MFGRNSILKNTLWSSVGNAFMAAVSFITTVFVVRNLGPSEYGIFQEAVAYFTIFLNFENVVNFNLFKKEIIKKPDTSSTQILNLALFVGFMAVLLTVSVFSIWYVFDLSQMWLLVGILLVSVFFRVSNGISFYFDAHLQTYKSQISLNVGNSIGCLIKYIASVYKPTALFQSLAYPIQYATTMVTHIVLFRETQMRFQWKIDLNLLRNLIIASFPLFLSGLVEVIQSRASYMYLGSTVTALDLGLFSASVKLTEPWLFLASAIAISFWPKLVSTFGESGSSYDKILSYFFGALFYMHLFIGISGWTLGSWIVPLVLGEPYTAAVSNFKIQSLVLIPQALCVGLTLIETNQGLAKISLLRNSLVLVFNFIALHIMVQYFGIQGASWAQLMTYVFSFSVVPLLFPETARILKSIVLSPVKSVIFYINR